MPEEELLEEETDFVFFFIDFFFIFVNKIFPNRPSLYSKKL